MIVFLTPASYSAGPANKLRYLPQRDRATPRRTVSVEISSTATQLYETITQAFMTTLFIRN